MLTLALDVDGVLLDPERGGQGLWTSELTARFGIERSQIDDAFFAKCWDDVIIGRRSVEDGLGEALRAIGLTADGAQAMKVQRVLLWPLAAAPGCPGCPVLFARYLHAAPVAVSWPDSMGL